MQSASPNLPQPRNSSHRRRNYDRHGRTGKPFAVQHWNIEPDLILVGKGIASGYAPLGAVLISARVAEHLQRVRRLPAWFHVPGSSRFHCAGNAVSTFLKTKSSPRRARRQTASQSVSPLEAHPNVGEFADLDFCLESNLSETNHTRTFPKNKNREQSATMLQKNVLVTHARLRRRLARRSHLLAPPFIVTPKNPTDCRRSEFSLEHVFPSKLG